MHYGAYVISLFLSLELVPLIFYDFDILPWTLTIFFLVLFPTTQREAYSWNIPTT